MKITFDANIFIARKLAETDLPGNFYLSAIVLQELVAGAPDEAVIKQLGTVRRVYEKAGRVLIPTLEDWWIVGTVINSLQRGRRSGKTHLIPKISIEERYRITSDVLIARTARRAGVTVITDNVADFEKIKKFCAVRIISGDDYFGKS